MIVKTHTKNKSDNTLSYYFLKNNEHAKILAGALRHEFNAKYFKGYKRILDPISKKKILSCPSKLLDSSERFNIRKTIQHLINEDRYYHYKKSSKKSNNNVPVIPFKFKKIKILNNTVYYTMTHKKSKNILKSESITYKLELERSIPDGIYERAGISLIDGRLKLIIDLKSKVNTEKSSKRNVSVKISKSLIKNLKSIKENELISNLGNKKLKIGRFEKRQAARKLERMKKEFFEIFWKIWKNYGNVNFECIKKFNKKFGKKYENQVLLPHELKIDDEIIAKMFDDLDYFYKTESKIIQKQFTYYYNILSSVS